MPLGLVTVSELFADEIGLVVVGLVVLETEAKENLEVPVVESTELVLGKGTGIRRRKAVSGVS